MDLTVQKRSDCRPANDVIGEVMRHVPSDQYRNVSLAVGGKSIKEYAFSQYLIDLDLRTKRGLNSREFLKTNPPMSLQRRVLPYLRPTSRLDMLAEDFVETENIAGLKLLQQVNRNALLEYACGLELPKVVRFFLSDPKVNPSYCYNGPVGAALGNEKIMNLLLKSRRFDPRPGFVSLAYQAITWSQRSPFCHSLAIRLISDKRVSSLNTVTPAGKYYGKLSVAKASCKYGNVDIMKRLLRDPRYHPGPIAGKYPDICHAIKQGHLGIAKVMLADPRVDPSDHDSLALVKAAGAGSLELVKTILRDKRINPNARNHAALRKAITKGATKIVRALLNDRRFDISEEDLNTAIEMAGHPTTRQLLVEYRQKNYG